MKKMLSNNLPSPSTSSSSMPQSVSIWSFHVPTNLIAFLVSDPVYPRIDVLEGLAHIVGRQPKLSREAVAVLVEVGEAIHESSTREEQGTLLRHTMAQEVYVRNAVLQALQPFDLTDVEWSPEVFIACHDDDEQNGRLARRLCDENGLEIPEDYISNLIPLLGECSF
jgi:hypothetical protein